MKKNEMMSKRGKQLFDYFTALVNLKINHVLDFTSYEEHFPLFEIPKKPGCHSAIWRTADKEDEESWIEVKKPKLKLPPKLPLEIKDWIEPGSYSDSSGSPPKALEKIVKPSGDKKPEAIEFLNWSDQSHLHAILQAYVNGPWREWAEEDRKSGDVQKCFSKLFSIYQNQLRLGETYEVVIGFGLLRWKSETRVLNRHILTVPCSVEFDTRQELLSVRIPGEGTKFSLETEWLMSAERPHESLEEGFSQRAQRLEDALTNFEEIHSIARDWVSSISSRSRYEKGDSTIDAFTTDPFCAFYPTLILRKRSQKSLLTVFKQIASDFELGVSSSGNMSLVLVGAESAEQPRSDVPPTVPRSILTDSEIYFPLPSNEQQTEIVRRLDAGTGVLVQGPPGTGKSHTIANLICHLLARGQRVLVTSHAPRALEVLKDKIPKDISPLCVCLLANDSSSNELMQHSVQGITSKNNNWDDKENAKQVFDLTSTLDSIRRAVAIAENEVIAMKERSSFKHQDVSPGYSGTEQEIAQLLAAKKCEDGWLDGLGASDSKEAIVGGRDLHLFISLSKEIRGLPEGEESKTLPPREAFPTISALEKAVSLEAELHQLIQSPSAGTVTEIVRCLESANPKQVEAITTCMADIQHDLGSIRNHIQSFWASRAASEVLADKDRRWKHLSETSRAAIDQARNASIAPEALSIEGLSEWTMPMEVLRTNVHALLEQLRQGKSIPIWPFSLFANSEVKFITKKIRVNGIPCNNTTTLHTLLKYVDFALALRRMDIEWKDVLTSLPTGSMSSRLHEYEDLYEPLQRALALYEKMEQARACVKNIPGLAEPRWHDLEDLERYIKAVRVYTAERTLAQIKSSLSALATNIRRNSGPNPFMECTLAAELIEKRDTKEYERIYKSLSARFELATRVSELNELSRRLKAFSPGLESALRGSLDEEIWTARADNFESARNWIVAQRWLQKRSQKDHRKNLESKIEQLRTSERSTLEKLASLRAWKHCFDRMSGTELQALRGWAQAIVQSTGKGKKAVYARKAAQTHLANCRSAIPAWIMPIHRVAESIPPTSCAFDVVIIDEASQCGPEAVFLAHIAKKVVVVGDDKQISPEAVAIEVEQMEAIKQRYLQDIPHAFHYGGAGASLFAIADILFPNRIRLREHFRCMPEIIQFSNTLSYSHEPLIPLKQFTSNRLTPTVATRHVKNGYEKGEKKSNPPEAEEVVAFIEACIADPRYKGKTIGVISLLGRGGNQINLINKLIAERISAKEIEARKIICGDAYSFQGDERDVICISMVVANSGERGIYAQTSESYKKRYNVAASRAREQMILFHSVTTNDLGSNDLRYALLSYCQNPRLEPVGFGKDELDKLKTKISGVRRTKGNQPEPFDSWFEVDVFMRITDRGFRVIPQYKVAGKRIDLVIDGPKGRVAVECDGDEWHGPEDAAADFNRQRLLERCGFTFWRVVGSEYYLDPDKAVEPLWTLLTNLGFHTCQDQEVLRPAIQNGPTSVEIIAEPEAQKSAIGEGNVPSTTVKTEALQGWDVTAALCKNVFNWNKRRKIMTNSRERILLSKLETVAFYLSRNRSVDKEVMRVARQAVERAIELGFDPSKTYPDTE